MKVSGCRNVIFTLVAVVFLVWPVNANPIDTTLVNYSIYQGNRSIDSPINLTVRCYGTYTAGYFRARDLPEKSTALTNTDLVYSYSLSCEPGNCFRNDIYGHSSVFLISSCDLEGMYKGKEFFVKNFTTNPEPDCITTKAITLGGYGEKTYMRWYAVSEEDLRYCVTKHTNDVRENCDKYLVSVKPVGQRSSREWRNNSWYYGTEYFIQCAINATSEQRLCYENHSLTNISILQQSHPSLYCEKRFDIPSDDRNSPMISCLTRKTYIPRSPVESLYCTLRQFFGQRCE